MFTPIDLFTMAHGLAAHSAARQGVIAQNVAHADTPGYRAQDLPSFAEIWRGQQDTTLRRTRAGHDMGSDNALRPREMPSGTHEPNGNSVSLEQQMIHAAELRHQHEMALSVYRSASNILRKSLGR